MKAIAERFFKLFAGLDRVHGHFQVPVASAANGHKVEGTLITTEKTGATPALWEQHLAGAYGLGIVPIRDDNTCVFGAVDIDVYNGLDLPALARRIAEVQLPLLVTRTKSGGGHLYTFARRPMPARLIRAKLNEWAIYLGHPGVEIFPKQDELTEDGHGSWINMPYFGGERSNRYGIALDGTALSMEDFLTTARALAIESASQLDISLPIDEDVETLFPEAPPCLQTLASLGFPEGTRNNALFNIAVYLKKRNALDDLDTYNTTYMNPPLSQYEVNQVKKSLVRKNYGFKCKDQPINSVCNRDLCLTRKFGIGSDGGDAGSLGVTLGRLYRYNMDPPMWAMEVNGALVRLTTDELMNQRPFAKRVVEVIKRFPNVMKPGAWKTMMDEMIPNSEDIEVPEDATIGGKIKTHLEHFVNGRAQARSLDEVLLGKPYKHDMAKKVNSLGVVSDRTYFRPTDFIKYLSQQHINGIDERVLYFQLTPYGSQSHCFSLKGRNVNCWSMPTPDMPEQTEPFDTPRQPPTGEF